MPCNRSIKLTERMLMGLSHIKSSSITVLCLFFIFVPVNLVFSAGADVLVQAEKFIQSGKYTNAESLLLAELKKYPKNVQLLIKLADISLKKNNLESAGKYLNRAFQIEPRNSNIFITSAELMRKNSQYSEAEEILQKLNIENPTDIGLKLMLGDVYLEDFSKNRQKLNEEEKQTLLNRSLNNYKQASNLSPNNADIHIKLAKVYLELEKTAKAYDEILIADELGIKDTENLYFLADFYFKKENYDKAMKILQRSELYNQNKSAKAHLILAEIYEKLGDIQNAKNEYEIALKIIPKDKTVEECIKRLVEMESPLTQLISADESLKYQNLTPAEETLLTNAFIYLVTDKFINGRNLYNQILENNPVNFYAKEGLIEFYYIQWLNECFNPKNYFEDYEFLEGLPDLEELKIANVKFNMMVGISNPIQTQYKLRMIAESPSLNYLQLLNSARAYFLLGEYNLSAYKTTSLINSPLPDAELYRIAGYLALDQNYYQAQKIFKSLVGKIPPEQINPVLERITSKFNNADAIFNEGKILYKKRKYDKASEKFRLAINTVPEHKLSHLYYGYSLHKKKHKQEALKEIRIYKELDTLYPSDESEITDKKLEKTIKKWEKEISRKK